jgi:hypothetical protein
MLSAVVAAIASQFEPVEPTSPPSFLFRGFRVRPVAMELALNREEIRRILGPNNQRNRALMRAVLKVGFLLIVTWCLLSVATAFLMWNEPFAYHRILAGLTVGLACVVAYYGRRSSSRIRRILSMRLMMSSASDVEDDAKACHRAATIKWSLIFTMMLLSSTLFFLGFGSWYSILGALLVITALRGFSTLWRDGKIERVLKYMLVTVVVMAVAYLLRAAT